MDNQEFENLMRSLTAPQAAEPSWLAAMVADEEKQPADNAPDWLAAMVASEEIATIRNQAELQQFKERKAHRVSMRKVKALLQWQATRQTGVEEHFAVEPQAIVETGIVPSGCTQWASGIAGYGAFVAISYDSQCGNYDVTICHNSGGIEPLSSKDLKSIAHKLAAYVEPQELTASRKAAIIQRIETSPRLATRYR